MMGVILTLFAAEEYSVKPLEGPVSQHEICQGEQHIQFRCLLSQPSVSCFTVSELPLYNLENKSDLCSDRRFLVFPAFDLRLRSDRPLFAM